MPNYILTEKMKSNKSVLSMRKCEDEFESIEIDWRKEATLKEVKDFLELNKIDNADDVQNAMGRTLLFNVVANSCGTVDVVIYDKILQYLITEKKANIDWTAAKWYNNTALMNCCANGETTVCLKLIKEFKANPFICDSDGKHALHLLIGKGRSRQQPIIKEILNRADIKDYIDSKMNGGFTPLHLACARGNIFYINYLLEAGASLESKDDNNRTPLQIISLSREERSKIIDIAYSHPAKEPVSAPLSLDQIEFKLDRKKIYDTYTKNDGGLLAKFSIFVLHRNRILETLKNRAEANPNLQGASRKTLLDLISLKV